MLEKVNNLPDYASEYDFIVVTEDSDGEQWFYGAYSARFKAREVAREIDGKVIER